MEGKDREEDEGMNRGRGFGDRRIGGRGGKVGWRWGLWDGVRMEVEGKEKEGMGGEKKKERVPEKYDGEERLGRKRIGDSRMGRGVKKYDGVGWREGGEGGDTERGG